MQCGAPRARISPWATVNMLDSGAVSYLPPTLELQPLMPMRLPSYIAPFCCALVFCGLVYWQALHGPFLFDDFPNLSALTSVDGISNWRDLGIYLSQPRNFPGRPLAMLSFLAQKSAWPDSPFPFKLVNLLIHLCNGLLVARLTFVLGINYLARTLANGESAKMRAKWAAVLATAAFLLNPIQLSAVLLVVQRMTLLMATFTLLGLMAYIHGVTATSASRWYRAAWIVLGTGGCMILAFLCKENGLLLPLYALVLDATILRRNVASLPHMLIWLRRLVLWPPVLGVFTFLLIKIPSFAASSFLRDFTLGQRLLTEPRVLLDYLGKIFLPRFGAYGLFNDEFPISHGLNSPPQTWIALIILFTALILGWALRRRSPLLSLAVLWYLGGQVLESTTVMLELYFEHRNYVPIIGAFVALALGICGLHNPVRLRLAALVAAIWLSACAITTALSARVWSSEDRLALFWAQQYPDSPRALIMLADRLYQHGQIDLAIDSIEQGLKVHPDNIALADIRTYLKCMQGTLTADDLHLLDVMLRSAPYNRAGFANLEKLRLLVEARTCPALGETEWRGLVAAGLANPYYRRDGVATGFMHYQLHLLAVHDGDLDTAVRELDEAYALDPDANISRLQAKYLASAGLYDQAIEHLEQVDYAGLPALRRLLVDDRAINAGVIKTLAAQKASGDKLGKPEPQPASPGG
jgi:tetratricopeptide (TPR) repeat protein